jgi:hypothetical protein
MNGSVTVNAYADIAGTRVTVNKTTSLTLTGTHSFAEEQDIGTSEELIAFPADAVTEGIGLIFLTNTDPTHPIDIKIKVAGTTYTFATLKAGDPPATFRTNAAAASDPALWAQASGGTAKLKVESFPAA